MTQPRDSKGRFSSNSAPQDGDITLIVIVCIILASFTYFGYQQGYGMGHSTGHLDGISENQPTIFQNGMKAGMEKQKKFEVFQNNCSVCSWNSYVWSPAYCENSNTNHVSRFDDNYNMIGSYYMPKFAFDGG